jgi:hypothetical protein
MARQSYLGSSKKVRAPSASIACFHADENSLTGAPVQGAALSP